MLGLRSLSAASCSSMSALTLRPILRHHSFQRIALDPPPPTKPKKTKNHQIRPPTPAPIRSVPSIQSAFELVSRTTTVLRTSAAPQLIFLGPPGVGKGTFAARLSTKWNIPHISTGDIIRSEISKRTPEGEAFQRISEQGDLVPDDLVIAIVENRLDEPDTQEGFVLDGFPRTQYQAEALDSFSGPFLAVDLTQPIGILVSKLSGRRVCEKCKATYNVTEIIEEGYEFKPLLPTQEQLKICEGCHSLKQRKDDSEEIIMRRLEIYDKETTPLKTYYERREMLESFHVMRGVQDFPRFEQFVNEAGRKRRLFYRQLNTPPS